VETDASGFTVSQDVVYGCFIPGGVIASVGFDIDDFIFLGLPCVGQRWIFPLWESGAQCEFLGMSLFVGGGGPDGVEPALWSVA
jgi:hypothetical protein